MDDDDSIKLLTMVQVMKILGLKSRSSIYKRLQQKRMPQPCKIGFGRIRWRQRDIATWVRNLETNG